jgi:uncharacterized protein
LSGITSPEVSLSTFILESLWIYPVKSLGGQRMSRVTITERGSFVGDREWLVVDGEGRMLWQGDLPKMTLLGVNLSGGTLSISRRDGATITVPANHDGVERTVTQYGNSFAGIDAGDDIASWLSEFLAHQCRLVRIGHQAHLWPKLNPVHLVSTRSLAVLNEQMRLLGEVGIEIERLRPNIVVSGEHEAFAEETTPVISFQSGEVRLNEPCIRCELPNISRIDASRQRQPLKLFGKMARERPKSKPASFGTYARATGQWLETGEVSRRES